FTKDYDYVLIDTPPSLDVTLSISLNASHIVIIPIEVSSLHSLEGHDKVLDLISAMQERNKDLRFLKLVMNKADRRTSVSKVLIARVLNDYGQKYCFKTIIPVCTAMQQAEYLHKTVFLHKPNEKITTLFKELATELVAETSEKL
ncbi:MAG: ParA family protein, partial [Desulfobacteraceae bacterium]|nr:ParA family protein [Desulfobacteraceae bacterium]